MTFTKLFSSITESTIWVEDDQTRLVWITMLAMADRKGRVWASVPGLANRARVPDESVRAALQKFLSPDHDSRTKDYEGRRIEEIDGGWRLLNHEKYREIRDDEAVRESKRKYINNRRRAERVENVEQSRPQSNQAEAEAEAEVQAKRVSGGRPSLEDVKVKCEMAGYPVPEGEAFWNHFEASGWIDKNGHPILRWEPKLASWITNARAKPLEAKHHNGPNTRPLSPLDIRTIIGAKEKKADALKAKHSSLTAQGDTWSNPKAFEEWRSIRKEIRQLNERLSNLA